MPHQLPRLLKIVFAATKPRLCLAVAPLILWSAQLAAQEPELFLWPQNTALGTPPPGNFTSDFQRAEVWQGKRRVDVGNQIPFEKAEILYGEFQSTRRPATPVPEQPTSDTAVVKSGTTRSGVVKSAVMSGALAAHELLTKAQQLADDGDLATATRLTEQARDLLTEPPRAQSHLPLETVMARRATPAATLELTTVGPRAEVEVTSTPSSRPAAGSLAPSKRAPLSTDSNSPQPSEVFRGTTRTLTEVESDVAGGTHVDSPKPSQHVVYNSPQRGNELANPVPTVTVNFDMSNNGGLPYANAPRAWSGDAGERAELPHPVSATATANPESTAASTIVLFFVGGLILGLGTLCVALIVFAKLITPRPIYHQEPAPLQATRPMPRGAELQEIETSPDAASEHRATKSTTASASLARAFEPLAPTSPTRKPRSSEERKPTGIMEGIFQENLRVQDRIGRVAEAA